MRRINQPSRMRLGIKIAPFLAQPGHSGTHSIS
jgi:hypothetical protein